jgi:hypothetical protein
MPPRAGAGAVFRAILVAAHWRARCKSMHLNGPERPNLAVLALSPRCGGGVGKDLIFLTSGFPVAQSIENTDLNCQVAHLTSS